MCGEYVSIPNLLPVRSGSSPRVRGTRLLAADGGKVVGIIPACAGNTRCIAVEDARGRDHPRVCGEHQLVILPCEYVQGSSPRVRGTPCIQDGDAEGGGIIPACAGNT